MAALAAIGALSSVSLAESRIGISDSQKNQLKALASNTRDRTGRERDAMRRARRDLFDVYSNYSIDERRAKVARNKVSAAQLCLLNIHLDNEIALRSILNADQFQKFKDMMKKRLHHPEMLILSPPEDAAFDRLPSRNMLTAMGVGKDDQKKLRLSPKSLKAIRNLGRDSNQLLDLYSKYTLDADAARKIIDRIHDEQTSLLTAQHRRQQVMRDVLSQYQFQMLSNEALKQIPERSRPKPPSKH